QMSKTLKVFLILAVAAGGFTQLTKAQDAKSSSPVVYSVSNDDVPVGYPTGAFNSGSVFVNGAYKTKISTSSYGIGSGYLGIHSVDIDVVDSQNECVFLSDAG